MPDLDDLMALTTIMEMNGGVLRQSAHRSSRRTFDYLVGSGAIVRVLPGTYLDAALLTSRRARCAAALAAYPGSLLWGADAKGALLATLDERPFGASDSVELVHAQCRRDYPGVAWLRRRVPDGHRVRVGGLRCPSALFLAVEAAARDQGALIEEFLRRGLIKPAELAAVLPALAGSPGHRMRQRIVRASADNPWSGGERHLHRLLRQRRVGDWVANAAVTIEGRTYHPDVLFEQARVVVEFDGYEVHSKREVFASDRRRQNRLVLAGYTVLRVTWQDVTERPDEVVDCIRRAVARNLTSAVGDGRGG